MVPALLHLAYTEGAGGLYAGMGTACASLGVSNLLYYALYALLRDALLRASPPRTSLGGVAALPVAAMAGALNVLATNPLWVLVTRLQAHHGGSGGADGGGKGGSSPAAVARQVYAEGGIAAFWRGTGASLVMVSNPVVQFAVFEWLMARAAARARARAGPGGKAAPVGKATVFACGALSKLAATLVTYPFLVLKSRQQAAHRPVSSPAPGGDKEGEAALRAAQPARVRLLAQLLAVAREEGVQGAVGGPESGREGGDVVSTIASSGWEGRAVNHMACFVAVDASPPHCR
jgi:adenine nucleotide transporter 17